MSARATRRAVLAALAALAAILPVAAPAQAGGPTAPVEALNAALLQAMHAGRTTPFAQRAALLEPVIERAFALAVILRASVGLKYATFSATEQAALLAAFTRYTVASYAANFDSYSGERFSVDPQTRAVGSEQVVQTHIVPATGAATRLDYVMRQGAEGWQVVDVLVDGSISRVAVQRSDFRSLLEAGGPARLTASLDDKATRLANGDKS